MENSEIVSWSFENRVTPVFSLSDIQSFREKLKSLSNMTGKLLGNLRKATAQSKRKRQQAGRDNGRPKGSSRRKNETKSPYSERNSGSWMKEPSHKISFSQSGGESSYNYCAGKCQFLHDRMHNISIGSCNTDQKQFKDGNQGPTRHKNRRNVDKSRSTPLRQRSIEGQGGFPNASCGCFRQITPKKQINIISSEILEHVRELHLTQRRQELIINTNNLRQPKNIRCSANPSYSTHSSDDYSQKSAGSVAPVVGGKPMMQQMVQLKRRKAKCGNLYQQKQQCKCGPAKLNPKNIGTTKVFEETSKTWGKEIISNASNQIESANIRDFTSNSSTSDAMYGENGCNPEDESISCHCCACLLNVKEKSVTSRDKFLRSRKFDKLKECNSVCKGYLEPDILCAVSSSAFSPAGDSSLSRTKRGQKNCICPLCGSKHLARSNPKNNIGYRNSSPCCVCQEACLSKATTHSTLKGSSSFTCVEESRQKNRIPLMCHCPRSASEITRIHSMESIKALQDTANNKSVARNMTAVCKTTQSPVRPQSRTCYSINEVSLKLSYERSNCFSKTEYICCKCKSEPTLSLHLLNHSSIHDEFSNLCLCETPTYTLSTKSSRQSIRLEKRTSSVALTTAKNAFEDNIMKKSPCGLCAEKKVTSHIDNQNLTLTTRVVNAVSTPSLTPSMVSMEPNTHTSTKSFKVHGDNAVRQCKCKSYLHCSSQSLLEIKSAHSSRVSENISNKNSIQKLPCICDICKRVYSSNSERPNELHSAECLCVRCLCPEESYTYINQHISGGSDEDQKCATSNVSQIQISGSMKNCNKDIVTLTVSENNKLRSESCTCIECCPCKSKVSVNEENVYPIDLVTSQGGCVPSLSKVGGNVEESDLERNKVNKEITSISKQPSESTESEQIRTKSPDIRCEKSAASAICKSADFSITTRISALGEAGAQIQTGIQSKVSTKVMGLAKTNSAQLELEGAVADKSKEKGCLTEDTSKCSCAKVNRVSTELPESCICIQSPTDGFAERSVVSNPSSHFAENETCVCTQNLCMHVEKFSNLEKKSIEASQIGMSEHNSHHTEVLKSATDEENPNNSSNWSGCSCQSSVFNGISTRSKSTDIRFSSKSTTVCSCSITSSSTIPHKAICSFESHKSKQESKNQPENEKKGEYESARITEIENLEKDMKISETRGKWGENRVVEAINETEVISREEIDYKFKDSKVKNHITCSDLIDDKCPNNCGCPDCPFLTAEEKKRTHKRLPTPGQNPAIYMSGSGKSSLVDGRIRPKTGKDSSPCSRDRQTTGSNFSINDSQANGSDFSMRGKKLQIQEDRAVQGSNFAAQSNNFSVQRRDLLVHGPSFPVQRKDYLTERRNLPLQGDNTPLNEIASIDRDRDRDLTILEKNIPLFGKGPSITNKNLTCSQILQRIRDVLCESRRESRDKPQQCAVCSHLRGGSYGSALTYLPRCECINTSEKNREYPGLTEFIANSCHGKRNQNALGNVTQIGHEYLNKAKDYASDDSLSDINTSVNSFFEFLFTEIKNIKNLLNFGLQKIEGSELTTFDAEPISGTSKCVI